jgi:hypothetical protein
MVREGVQAKVLIVLIIESNNFLGTNAQRGIDNYVEKHVTNNTLVKVLHITTIQEVKEIFDSCIPWFIIMNGRIGDDKSDAVGLVEYFVSSGYDCDEYLIIHSIDSKDKSSFESVGAGRFAGNIDAAVKVITNILSLSGNVDETTFKGSA